MKPLLLLALLSASMSAQTLNLQNTAQVIQLSATESQTAKSLAEEQEALDKRKVEFNELIVKKYLQDKPNHWMGTWRVNGYEFSSDWQFIVPSPQSASRFICGSSMLCGTTLTPAIGVIQ